MDIEILQLIEGAKKARGLAIIIDVFRAFTLECYLFERGIKKSIVVGDIDLAFRMKRERPEYLLFAERGGKPVEGADFGNSPTVIENISLEGKTIIHTTSAGTQGIVNAVNADEVITGSFVNAKAIVRYIERTAQTSVSLVCMGKAGLEEGEEDTLCAEYIRSIFQGSPMDPAGIKKHLRASPRAKRFFDPVITWMPERDFDLCMNFNAFDFVLQAKRKDNMAEVAMLHVS